MQNLFIGTAPPNTQFTIMVHPARDVPFILHKYELKKKYDLNGNLRFETDAADNTFEYTYDEANRKIVSVKSNAHSSTRAKLL